MEYLQIAEAIRRKCDRGWRNCLIWNTNVMQIIPNVDALEYLIEDIWHSYRYSFNYYVHLIGHGLRHETQEPK